MVAKKRLAGPPKVDAHRMHPNRARGNNATSRQIHFTNKTPQLLDGEKYIQEWHQLHLAANDIIQEERGYSAERAVSVPRMAQVLEGRLNRRGFGCNVHYSRREGATVLIFVFDRAKYIATPSDLTIPIS